jgi:hypothetical protein
MLAIGFIPDRHDGGAMFGGQDASAQLSARLPSEAISHSERKFFEQQRCGHLAQKGSTTNLIGLKDRLSRFAVAPSPQPTAEITLK